MASTGGTFCRRKLSWRNRLRNGHVRSGGRGERRNLFSADWRGRDRLIAYDMGGTSTDVLSHSTKANADRHNTVVAGMPISIPQIDIHSVGTGGGQALPGSIWTDARGLGHAAPVPNQDPSPNAKGGAGNHGHGCQIFFSAASNKVFWMAR